MYFVYDYTCTIVRNVQVIWLGNWHIYLALGLPGCHFLFIFASKVSLKNKGEVSNCFGQSVTNDTSTIG